MVMVNLGSTDDSRYTGYCEITDRDVLDLQCIDVADDSQKISRLISLKNKKIYIYKKKVKIKMLCCSFDWLFKD